MRQSGKMGQAGKAMAIQQVSRWCRQCDRHTLHERRTFDFAWGCLLTVVTCGFFGPIWLSIVLWEIVARGYRCQVCGTGRYW